MNVGNTGGRRDCKSSKTAATADCSHSKDSCKNVNSGKNINKSKMKTTQIQPKHQGGNANNSRDVRTCGNTSSRRDVRRRHGSAGSQNSKDHKQ